VNSIETDVPIAVEFRLHVVHELRVHTRCRGSRGSGWRRVRKQSDLSYRTLCQGVGMGEGDLAHAHHVRGRAGKGQSELEVPARSGQVGQVQGASLGGIDDQGI